MASRETTEALAFFHSTIPRFSKGLSVRPPLLHLIHRAVVAGNVSIAELRKIGEKYVKLDKEKKAAFSLLAKVARDVGQGQGARAAVKLLAEHVGNPAGVKPLVFELQDLFQKATPRRYFDWEKPVPPVLHLLFSRKNFPVEHNDHYFWIDSSSASGAFREATEGGTKLREVVVWRKQPNSREGGKVFSLYPVPKKAREGIHGFGIEVFDRQYLDSVKVVARALHRLTKKPVRVKHSFWRRAP